MTKWKLFRITGPLWWESTGHRWIPPDRFRNTDFWQFFVVFKMDKRSSYQWCGDVLALMWRHHNESWMTWLLDAVVITVNIINISCFYQVTDTNRKDHLRWVTLQKSTLLTLKSFTLNHGLSVLEYPSHHQSMLLDKNISYFQALGMHLMTNDK